MSSLKKDCRIMWFQQKYKFPLDYTSLLETVNSIHYTTAVRRKKNGDLSSRNDGPCLVWNKP